MRIRAIACLLALAFGAGSMPQAAAGELDGTSWRLVKIASMDDSVAAPDDPARYTLEFAADGRVSIQADCNRGTGSWISESAGQLIFGPIASTRAMCPPGSVSEKYLAQFEWVRSYVMKAGRLFLATMADGSIVEFEPAESALAATVLGEEIRTSDPAEMQRALLTRLFDHYASERGIDVDEAEVEACVESLRRGTAAEGLAGEEDLAPDEAAEVDAMRRDMGRALVRQWKIDKSLHEAYGGRVVYQQLGPEPLDAYRRYLEERQAAGDFTIRRRDLADEFWRYFTDESIHDFMEPGGEDEARAFAAPPWEQKP